MELPDCRTQIVDYYVDEYKQYHADVKYEGEICPDKTVKHPHPAPYHPAPVHHPAPYHAAPVYHPAPAPYKPRTKYTFKTVEKPAAKAAEPEAAPAEEPAAVEEAAE